MHVLSAATLRRTTGLRILLALCCLVLGVLALVWPARTLLVVAVLLGLQLVLAGAVRLFAAGVLKSLPGWWRAVSAVLGGLTLIAGILCLARPRASLVALIWILAIGWLLDGLSETIAAMTVQRTTPERVGLVVFGLVSVTAAVVLLVYPEDSLILLARTGGIVLLVFAVVLLGSAFLARATIGAPRAAQRWLS